MRSPLFRAFKLRTKLLFWNFRVRIWTQSTWLRDFLTLTDEWVWGLIPSIADPQLVISLRALGDKKNYVSQQIIHSRYMKNTLSYHSSVSKKRKKRHQWKCYLVHGAAYIFELTELSCLSPVPSQPLIYHSRWILALSLLFGWGSVNHNAVSPLIPGWPMA